MRIHKRVGIFTFVAVMSLSAACARAQTAANQNVLGALALLGSLVVQTTAFRLLGINVG